VKLSNKGRYAVRALFDIAFFNDNQPTQVRDIAERQGIPVRFLEQIFQELKRAQLVTAKRGPKGGYCLAQGAERIRLGDVVRAVEGPIELGRGRLEGDAAPLPGKAGAKVTKESLRVMEDVFGDLSNRVEACFDAVSVQDMCERAESLGVRKKATSKYSYVI
jgi:Rrf2 family protein